MDLTVILIICSITACIISTISLILGLYSTVKVLAMEKSTHSVQWMPMEGTEWETPEDKTIDKINTSTKEDNEDFYGV